jgi:methionyl-tRNA formyltransferase
LHQLIPPIDRSADLIKIFVDGQGPLAHAVTRKLIENHGIDRKNILVNTYHRADNAVYKEWLQNQCIDWFTGSYQNQKVIETVSDFGPDYIISAYGLRIMPEHLLDLARIVALNMHPSYLPDYKGRWIASWAIINGETDHGITIHIMDKGIDTGPILLQQKLPVSIDDTAHSLYNKLMYGFINVFDDFFRDLTSGMIRSRVMPQGGRYFTKNVPFQGRIDPGWSIDTVERFIRAMFYPPHRGAELRLNGSVYECLTIQDYQKIIKLSQISTGHPRP